MVKFCIWLASFHLIAGAISAIALKQDTHYATDSVWTMVLLWPLYLVA